MKIHDSVFGLLVAIIGSSVIYSVSGFPKMSGQDVGPAMFPGAVGALLVVFGVLLFVRSRTLAEPSRVLVAFGDWATSPRHIAAGLSVILGCLIYLLFSDRLGFLVLVPLLLLVWHMGLGARWQTAVFSAVGTTAVIWGFFYKMLGVPLPWGLLKSYAF